MKDKGGILLVTGKTQDAELIMSSLHERGYSVQSFMHGREALDAAHMSMPAIIISYIDIDGMDGYEFCRKIREIPRYENVPFIFIAPEGKSGEETIKGLKLGADDFVNSPVIPDEIALRVDIILARLKILHELTITDEVTRLHNRRYFDQRMDEEVERLKRYNRPLLVFIIDIDNFKNVNDVYGHKTGDELLRSVGLMLQSVLRQSDVLCRFGGDEFAVIMPEHDRNSSLETAERLRKTIENFVLQSSDNGKVSVTVSVGGIWLSENNRNGASEVIREADRNLFKVKKKGRNGVEITFS